MEHENNASSRIQAESELAAAASVGDAENIIHRTCGFNEEFLSCDAGVMSTSEDTHKPVKSIEDFKFLKGISAGAYGNVYLGCQKDKPGELYAIKLIRKEDVVRKNMAKNVMTERKAFCLSAADPFCVRLFYSFQTLDTVYLVMEYMIGGDLKSLLSKMGGYFPLAMAAFYIAEMSLALDFIHKCGVVHRDVKPDNVLIDSRGHIKLTDFGLSQVNMDVDVTPRRMNNFTPGQLMSLKTEFCFPHVKPHTPSGKVDDVQTPEEMRGNENSWPIPYDMSTPLCGQELPSIVMKTRRVRKPLRKLRNVQNQTVSSNNSKFKSNTFASTKLSPDLPSEWSIIQTPVENRPKFTSHGSFVNVSFCEYSNLHLELSPIVAKLSSGIHHSSPIDSLALHTKLSPPILSPLVQGSPPEDTEPRILVRSPAMKRHKSGNLTTPGVKLKIRSQSSSSIAGSNNASNVELRLLTETPEPECNRRDHSPTYYGNFMDTLNHFTAGPLISIMKDENSNSNLCNNLFKRKRWISATARTGVSMDFERLELGLRSSLSHEDPRGNTEKPNNFNNISPPNQSGGRIVGTPDYLAPEIIGRRAHGPPVDWWSLGVCFYEFVVGCLPFSDESLTAIFSNIESRNFEFPPPDILHPSVQNCIEALLELNPETRADLSRLQNEEFDVLFDWNNLSTAQPPFVPNPTSPTDTAYFMPRNIEQNIRIASLAKTPKTPTTS